MAFVKEMTVYVRSVITALAEGGVPQGEDEVTELSAPVLLKFSDGGLSLTYTEQAEGGKTVCHVAANGDRVTVSRRGASECDMHFGDAEDEGVYSIPPYSFPMKIRTLKIRNRLTQDGGVLDLFYRMNLGGDDRKVHLRLDVR